MPATDGSGSLSVLTAVANPSMEAALVAALSGDELGVTVIRRCVDLLELLSAASAGTAGAALISADLRGLDREAVTALTAAGLGVVGLAADEAGDRLLHQLGVPLVVPAEAPVEQVAGALLAAAQAARDGSPDAAGSTREASPSVALSLGSEPFVGRGRLLAIWGPAGAPGRTTVAVGLADALAAGGTSVMLVDADPYGGCVAIHTGLLDEAPGLAAACRAANAGLLDVPRLALCSLEISPGLRVLTGLTRPSRWPEIRPSALDVVLGLARHCSEVTVVDTGFCLEDDSVPFGGPTGGRNAATVVALREADRVIAIAGADPSGLARLVRELPSLEEILGAPLVELVAAGRLTIVLNRVRAGLGLGDAATGSADALSRHAGVRPALALPYDVAAADAAHGRGALLSDVAAGSALHQGFLELADLVMDRSPSPASRRGRGARGRGVRRRHRSGQAV